MLWYVLTLGMYHDSVFHLQHDESESEAVTARASPPSFIDVDAAFLR